MLTRRHTFRGNSRKTITALKKALDRFHRANSRALAFNAAHDTQQPTFWNSEDLEKIAAIGLLAQWTQELLSHRTLG